MAFVGASAHRAAAARPRWSRRRRLGPAADAGGL